MLLFPSHAELAAARWKFLHAAPPHLVALKLEPHEALTLDGRLDDASFSKGSPHGAAWGRWWAALKELHGVSAAARCPALVHEVLLHGAALPQEGLVRRQRRADARHGVHHLQARRRVAHRLDRPTAPIDRRTNRQAGDETAEAAAPT